MQKWEYKHFRRTRGYLACEKGEGLLARSEAFHRAGSWSGENIGETLTQLGEEGWELVSVVPRSTFLGGTGATTSHDYAGFTNEELWIFKRPKD